MKNKYELQKAKEAATNTFNSLPYDVRKRLANGYDRLLEINLLLSKGDSLSMKFIKQRKRELEQWLLEWYNEIEQ